MPPIAVKLVIVTAFPPELSGWTASVPLGESLLFPGGQEPGHADLRLNSTLGVLGVTSGMGPTRAAASLLALGFDDRFDLRFAYWLVAGIAGVDPIVGSIGSVFISRHLVSLGQGYQIDGTGYIPDNRKSVNFGPPLPSADEAQRAGVYFELDGSIASWVFQHASTATLRDTPRLERARAGYTAANERAARQPPSVRYGDSATGETFWAGRVSTQWARNVTSYWSGGRATFAVSQEEDLAFAASIHALGRLQRANASRLAVLRSVSDYCYAPDGVELLNWFFHDPTHMCTDEAFEALVLAGTPVLRAVLSLPEEAFAAPAAAARAASRPLETNAGGVVIVLPWGVAFLLLMVVFGVAPLALAALGGIVLHRRRQRHKRAASSVTSQQVRHEVHMMPTHVQLREERGGA